MDRVRLARYASVANAVLTAGFWLQFFLRKPDNDAGPTILWWTLTPLLTLIVAGLCRGTGWHRFLWLNLGPIALWALTIVVFVFFATVLAGMG